MTAVKVLVEASSVVAIQTVAAVKGSDYGDGSTVEADAMKSHELGSLQQEEGAVSVAPLKKAAEEVTAIGAIHGVSGTEHDISSCAKSGGELSGVATSNGPTEPTSASTTTAEQVIVEAST
jgi:hypothetical protein